MNKTEPKPDAGTESLSKLWGIFAVNSVAFLVSLYYLFTAFDKWPPALAGIITGATMIVCWFHLRRLRPGEEDAGPLGEP